MSRLRDRFYQVFFISFMFSSFAQDTQDTLQTGLFVKLEGHVEVFTHPSTGIPSGSLPHALFEGKNYTVEQARLGMKIENGNIVRTISDGKARIHFTNGDQYNVGPNTTYKVEWPSASTGSVNASTINLMYGKLRGIISKKGPRSGLQIQTQSNSIGIRGTDFYVNENPLTATRISVLRGEVLLTPTNANSTPILIKQGQSSYSDLTQHTQAVEVGKITQVELFHIQNESIIKQSPALEQQTAPEVLKEINKLEKKAIETTLEDIKMYDKEFHSKIKDAQSVAIINTEVIKEIFKSAPPKSNKPTLKELENINIDAYKKYFNPKFIE